MKNNPAMDALVQWGLDHIAILTEHVPEAMLSRLISTVRSESGDEFSIKICVRYHKEHLARSSVPYRTIRCWYKEIPLRLKLEELRRNGELNLNRPLTLFPLGTSEGRDILGWEEKTELCVF